MKLVSQSLVGRAVGPSSGSSWLYYTLLLHAWNYTKLFQVLVLSQVTLEIKIKKVQKQDLNIKNVKRCRDGRPKVSKQGTDNA